MLITAPTVMADQLVETARLARAGAGQLALARIDQLQPPYLEQPVEWLRWEEERLAILQMREDWVGIIQRAQNLPDKTPDSFRNKTFTLAADARLAQGEVEAARAIYRQLLWQENRSAISEQEQRRWREGIIRSYLAETMLKDAEIAIRRYSFDYPQQQQRTLPWMADVLVQQGRYAEAVALRSQVEQQDIALILDLAELRLNGKPADAQVQRAWNTLSAREQVAYEQWVIFAEAAAMVQDHRLQIACLEQAVLHKPYRSSKAFQLSGSQLWDAYIQYGRQYGNQQQLLIGDDENWFAAATELLDQDPTLARALFAVLAFESLETNHRRLAHDYLVNLVADIDQQGRLLKYLYLDNPRFATMSQIPSVARYQLVDHAIAQGDIGLASELMQDLEAPGDAEQIAWQLRRARVLILGNAITQGVEILADMTKQPVDEAATIDALVQVVFDLQKINRHREALQIFQQLQVLPLENQRRRELFFWMAESYTALGQHDEAAHAYLESAILENEQAMDQWAQTARYHAAKSLASAGYRGDAQTVLEQLLRVTRDKERRAVLRQELIQLKGYE